jgi:hypothetical protein
MLKKAKLPRRNDRCPCGSGRKYKHCCSHSPEPMTPLLPSREVGYIDEGEAPVRYVIANHIGTSFFSTKDNKVIVFKNRAEAFAIATLPDFQDQDPGEINVAGVGPTKWQRLQEKLPYVEVDDIEHAAELIRERIEHIKQEIENTAVPGEEPLAGDNQPSTEVDSTEG